MSSAPATSSKPQAPVLEAAGLPEPSPRFRARQLQGVVRLELRKSFLSRRALGLLVLAAAAPFLLTMRILFAHPSPDALGESTQAFAGPIFQAFLLRIVLFLGCVSAFGNLIRREVLDRTLHFYFLSPIRRELLVVGKFLTGWIATFTIFGAATVASFVLSYVNAEGGAAFLASGTGMSHLARYLLVVALGCCGYGALFLTFGFFFRSPAIPALLVFGWEGIHFLLPPFLKQASVIHYLQALCPVPVSEGPLALVSDAPHPVVAVLGVLLFSAALVAVSAWRVRKMEIKYEED